MNNAHLQTEKILTEPIATIQRDQSKVRYDVLSPLYEPFIVYLDWFGIEVIKCNSFAVNGPSSTILNRIHCSCRLSWHRWKVADPQKESEHRYCRTHCSQIEFSLFMQELDRQIVRLSVCGTMKWNLMEIFSSPVQNDSCINIESYKNDKNDKTVTMIIIIKTTELATLLIMLLT